MFSSIVSAASDALTTLKWPSSKSARWGEMLRRNWYLGLTSFGGPAVHFQIFRRMFVEKYQWIDEQMFQELFALCQALPGPASTKMLYCINCIHCGFLPGVVSFFIWSLPAAVAAFGLGLGVAQIGQTLPGPVYALLSGLNAATVGIIALAAVQLSRGAITDNVTRILVFFGATAGMLYNALWYFPVLMVASGICTIIWDFRWLHRLAASLKAHAQPTQAGNQDVEASSLEMADAAQETPASLRERRTQTARPLSEREATATPPDSSISHISTGVDPASRDGSQDRTVPSGLKMSIFSWRQGVVIAALFAISFVVIMALRGALTGAPRGFSLFANLYLAGTIIFGGGPVVIPLLREYVVAEGWVSPRDFLLGLAIVQSFPGPNFNFAVYLGALAVQGTSVPTVIGALIGYIAIFAPGLILITGTMGVWQKLRSHRWLISCLRGVNAGAVGLIYTAVYRLWRIGYLRGGDQAAGSLESDPWWVVITATSFVGGMWFKLQAPVAILLGGAMGMVWYGIVKT